MAGQAAIGDAAPAVAATAVMSADTVLQSAGAVLFPGGAGDMDVISDGPAQFYLYRLSSANLVTAVYGPYEVRPYGGARRPVPGGCRADMLHVTSMDGSELIITPRG